MKPFINEKKGYYFNTNLIIVGLIIFYLILSLIFKSSVVDSKKTIFELIILLSASLFTIKIIGFIKKEIVSSLLQVSFVLLFFSIFYEVSSKFQLIIEKSWQDAKLIQIDDYIFGQELSLKMQSIVSPFLTETMMFAYVFYILLLIITAITAYVNNRGEALSKYLFVLSLGYILCYVGFILFPIASQMYFMPEKYTVPLKGGFFTYLSELMRHNVQFCGGSLPSPHCTAATIVLWACYKNNKKIFCIIIPTIILLYISTIYGRFHYLMDSVAGILTGILAIIIYPFLERVIEFIKVFFNSLFHPVYLNNSLSED